MRRSTLAALAVSAGIALAGPFVVAQFKDQTNDTATNTSSLDNVRRCSGMTLEELNRPTLLPKICYEEGQTTTTKVIIEPNGASVRESLNGTSNSKVLPSPNN